MSLLFSHLNFFPDLYMEWILCQIRLFRKICHVRKTHNYQHPSFVILLTSFLPNVYKFLPSVIFIKLSFVKTPLFVISFVFGQTLELSIFAEICHFLIIAICQVSPLCHLIWVFAKPLIDSCPIPHFPHLQISSNRQLSILLGCTWRHGGYVGGQEQKQLSPLWTKLYFHVNYSRKIILYWPPTLLLCLVVANQECLFCGLI